MEKFSTIVSKPSATLTIFDLDDTLFYTFALVHLKKNGERIRSLQPNEFTNYILGPDEEFDFNEFRDAEKFFQTSKPIRKMLTKAKRIVHHGRRNPLSQNIIVTARANLDDRDLFLSTFHKYGLDINKMFIERAGNLDIGASIAERKVIIIEKYLNQKIFKKARMFDDSESNLVAFKSLKLKYPNIIFEAYLVHNDGNITHYG